MSNNRQIPPAPIAFWANGSKSPQPPLAKGGKGGVAAIRADFPLLSREVNGKVLAYLDNAATTQKPEAVLRAMDDFYRRCNANVHRSAHSLADEATELYEQARQKVAAWIGASVEEVIFVRGATEGLNLIAQTWGKANLKAGDTVLVSAMEHHSNLLPWQQLADEQDVRLAEIPIDSEGQLVLGNLIEQLKPKLVAVTHASNVLGTVNNVRQIAAQAHAVGAKVLVDATQSFPHLPVNVQELGCDFLVCSGHKVYGPMGIGAVYGKRELLGSMPPYHRGGHMIDEVKRQGSSGNVRYQATWAGLPDKFEGGTPNVAGAVGFAAALDYLMGIGWEVIRQRETELTRYGLEQLRSVPGLKVHGPSDPSKRVSLFAFSLDGVHPHDLSTLLDQQGIAVRAGHHCAQPLHDLLGVPATTRASLTFYNTREEIDRLVASLRSIAELFSV